jgi:hypothetical protein
MTASTYMLTDAQIVARLDPAVKVEFDAIARALDVPASKLLRDLIDDAMPRLRGEAEQETSRRENLPHGVTAEALEQSLVALLRSFSRGEPIRLAPRDLFTPASKALWTLLGYIWRADPGADDAKAAARLARLVAQFKDTHDQEPAPRKVESRPIRPTSRRSED